jgi:hypothetical protein
MCTQLNAAHLILEVAGFHSCCEGGQISVRDQQESKAKEPEDRLEERRSVRLWRACGGRGAKPEESRSPAERHRCTWRQKHTFRIIEQIKQRGATLLSTSQCHHQREAAAMSPAAATYNMNAEANCTRTKSLRAMFICESTLRQKKIFGTYRYQHHCFYEIAHAAAATLRLIRHYSQQHQQGSKDAKKRSNSEFGMYSKKSCKL